MLRRTSRAVYVAVIMAYIWLHYTPPAIHKLTFQDDDDD